MNEIYVTDLTHLLDGKGDIPVGMPKGGPRTGKLPHPDLGLPASTTSSLDD